MVDKVCKVCTQLKPVIQFHFYAENKPSGKCKSCHILDERKRQKALWLNNPEYRERHNLIGKMIRRGEKPPPKPLNIKGCDRQCKVCHVIKHVSEFPLRGNHRLNTCIPCYNEQENLKARKRYREDPDVRARKKFSANKSRIRYEYNVELEEVLKTLEDQQFKCANKACGVEISLTAPKELVERANIDHDHATGKFRALLCASCNLLLGRIEKNVRLVDGLKDYLNKHKH